MSNTNIVILMKGKDVQKVFPLESPDYCWKLLRTIKDCKNKKVVMVEDFIEHCNEEFNLNLTKEKMMEVLKINKKKPE